MNKLSFLKIISQYKLRRQVNLFKYSSENKTQQQNQQQKEKKDKYQSDSDSDYEQEKKERTTQAEQENQKSSQYKENVSNFTKGFRFFRYSCYLLISLNLYSIYKEEKDQYWMFFPFKNIAQFISDRYCFVYDFITKPPCDKLLPDQIRLPGLREPPKTLVFNLTGCIVHQKYQMGKGLSIIKRPGLTNLLKKLSQKYEIVIFADDSTIFVESCRQILDPYNQIFMGALGNESIVYDSKGQVRDLKYLNRDLKNVIVIDCDPSINRYQPENSIIIPEFEGNLEDNKLYELIPLLEYLASPAVKDVRQEIQKLGKNPETAYLQLLNQRKEQIEKKRSGGFFSVLQNQNQFKKA